MAIQFRASATVSSGASPRTVNKPAGTTAGDLLILHVGLSQDVEPSSVPDGFVFIPGSEIAGSQNIRLYSKVATSAEPENYSASFPGAGNMSLAMTAIYSDAGKSLEVDAIATQTNASSTDRTWAAVTTTVADTFLMCFGTFGSSLGSTPAANMTERYDTNTGPRIYLMTQPIAAVGDTGTRTATGTALASKCVTVAFAEGEAGPGPLLRDTALGSNSGTTTPSVAKPGTVGEGDLLVIQLAIGNNAGVVTAAPSGFQEIPGTNWLGFATSCNMVLYVKTATAEEPSSYQFTTSHNAAVALLVLYSPQGKPIGIGEDIASFGRDESDTVRFWESINITLPYAFLACFAVYSTNFQTTPDAVMAEVWDLSQSVARFYLMVQQLLPVGETGTRTGTGTATNNLRSVTIAFVEIEDSEPPSAIEGSLSATLAALTVTAEAAVSIAGELAATLAALTLEAEAEVVSIVRQAELEATLEALTLEASADVAVSAEASIALEELTLESRVWALSIIVIAGSVRGAGGAATVRGAAAGNNKVIGMASRGSLEK